MTILDAFENPRLLGRLFEPLSSWWRWLVLAKAAYGLALDEAELEAFQHHTGRTGPRSGGYLEVVVETGRQAGKTKFASAVVAFEALRARREPGQPSPYALLVAQDLRSALRASFAYIAEAFEAVPELRQSVVTKKAETLELANGCVAACYPCRPHAVRGIRSNVCVLDELAFFQSTEGFPRDVEMLRAVRPTLATTGGKLIILSSPYFQSGALWDLHRQHFGREDSSTLIWQASAPEMNPTLPADYLQRMEQDDPEAYRSEVLGEFRAGLSTLLDPEALAACVEDGVRERAFEPGKRTFGFCDPSSGSGKDSFTVAIAHLDYGSDRAVLDVVRAWKPPFNPSGVIGEASDLLKSYGLRETTGDRYAPGFVSEGFSQNGIAYRASDQDRSTLYLELLPGINAGRVVLLDDAEMLRELRGLERRRGTTGRDRIDHRAGAHDDRANSAAGALVLALAAKRRSGIRMWDFETGQIIAGFDRDGNEWRDGRSWNGVFSNGEDPPFTRWARVVDGKIVEYINEKGGARNG